eukprot:jgi/Ulvmu1/11273/UM073_0045.1
MYVEIAITRLEIPLVRRILASRNRDQPFIASGNNILYLETETDRILFDTGNGPDSAFGVEGQLISNLEAQGIPRESITRVLLSHAHSDHIGGLLLDGNSTLAFPSATIHISRVEFDYWLGGDPPFSDSDLSPEMIGSQEASIAPVLEQIESQVELFEFGDEVLPNITAARNASWHTPGSTIFRIAPAAGAPVFFLGDSVIDEQLGFGHPYLKVAFDSVNAAASIGHVELLDAVAAEAGLAVPSHVAFPALGQVVPNGVYFDFLHVPPPIAPAVETTCPA